MTARRRDDGLWEGFCCICGVTTTWKNHNGKYCKKHAAEVQKTRKKVIILNEKDKREKGKIQKCSVSECPNKVAHGNRYLCWYHYHNPPEFTDEVNFVSVGKRKKGGA